LSFLTDELNIAKIKRDLDASRKAYAELHRLYRSQLKEIEFLQTEMSGMEQYLANVEDCYNRTVDEMLEFNRMKERMEITLKQLDDPKIVCYFCHYFVDLHLGGSFAKCPGYSHSYCLLISRMRENC
jgi:septal ring factor EnvC (AmiA/AmiB activator)